MSAKAIAGMNLFYDGDGNGNPCADCHSGKFQPDHSLHAMAMPQIGPGRSSKSREKTGGQEDFGREQKTGIADDILEFRTSNLRNVARTVSLLLPHTMNWTQWLALKMMLIALSIS